MNACNHPEYNVIILTAMNECNHPEFNKYNVILTTVSTTVSPYVK
jgi:hypothetical protein